MIDEYEEQYPNGEHHPEKLTGFAKLLWYQWYGSPEATRRFIRVASRMFNSNEKEEE